MGCELVFHYLKKARVKQKAEQKNDQNYLKASHLGSKCILLTLLYVSKLYEAINKDCIIAEDKMGVNVSRKPSKPLASNKLNTTTPNAEKCYLGCW